MRLHFALAFAILGAAVEALPVADTNTDITQPLDIKNTLPDNPAIEKRQLAQTTTVKGNDVVTISKSQGTTHDNTGYSWKPAELNNNGLKRRQLAKGTGTDTVRKGDFDVTVSKSQGTTGDRVGYSWAPASGSVVRRQDDGAEDEEVVRDGGNVVTTSKSQGTTGDQTGYSWRPAGLGEK